MIAILTGDSGCGKTQALMGLLAQACLHGVQTSGVVCPAVLRNALTPEGITTQKIGIDALLLPQKERLHFAMRRDLATKIPRDDKGLHWIFDEDVTRQINEHFMTLHTSGTSGTPGGTPGMSGMSTGALLVVDELGPLEFIHNQGFTAALDVHDAARYQHALIVVRPSLVEVAQKRWAVAEVLTPEDLPDFFKKVAGYNPM
jgi:nucleoside-triphosphatase THEP1